MTLVPLQRVLHAAARTVLDLKLGDHCHSCFAGVALVADHRENTVQAVPACAQDVHQARSRLHCQPVDAGQSQSLTVRFFRQSIVTMED